MMHVLRRFEARGFRFWGEYGALVARVFLVLFFVAEAISSRSPRADIADGPLDAAARVLSIITVGHVTFAAAPGAIGLLDAALAVLLLAFAASRLTAVVAVIRALLALASLLILHDELFVNFPLHLNAFGWGALASLLVCGGAWLVASSAHWQALKRQSATEGVLCETEEQVATRLRCWKRFAWTFAPLVGISVIAWPFFWPRYLTWFHARQEAAAWTNI